MEEKSLLSNWLNKVRNNKVIAAVIFVSLVITGADSVIESMINIKENTFDTAEKVTPQSIPAECPPLTNTEAPRFLDKTVDYLLLFGLIACALFLLSIDESTKKIKWNEFILNLKLSLVISSLYFFNPTAIEHELLINKDLSQSTIFPKGSVRYEDIYLFSLMHTSSCLNSAGEYFICDFDVRHDHILTVGVMGIIFETKHLAQMKLSR